MTWRVVAGRALVAAAVVVTVLAIVAGYIRHVAVNSGQFANRATDALRDDSVRSLIAQKITDEVVLRRESDLTAARPLIESVTSQVVATGAFTAVFRTSVRDLHRALFDRDQHTLTLTLGDIGTVVAAGLQVVRPQIARQVEAINKVDLFDRDIGRFSSSAVRTGKTIKLLAVLLALLAVALAGLALWAAPDTRTGIVELGIGAAAGGVLLAVAWSIVRTGAIDHFAAPDARAAAGAVWSSYLGDLRTEAWLFAGSGAVVSASAASLIRPFDIHEPLVIAGRWVITEPASRHWRIVRGVSLTAAGILVLAARDAVLSLLFTLAGVYLVYAGVSAILRLVYVPQPDHPAPPMYRAVREERRSLAVPAVAFVVIFAAIAILIGSGSTTTPAPALTGCEGSQALCDRPLDQVALPATHNSMSVPLPGWYSAEQDRPIAQQLHDGIRGLLIDTHYAEKLPNGKLKTDIDDIDQYRRVVEADGISDSAFNAALRIRDRLGFAGKGKQGIYLCHSFCELGATPLDSVLHDLNDFLVANPDQVVVVINQDYVTPKDFVAAVNKAGLGKLVYRGPTKGHFWTLRQMINRDQRVVFLAENHAGGADWYHPAYQAITEETPYTFKKVRELTAPAQRAASCGPNRGPRNGAPLFLVNHWITTDPLPLPSNAKKVNAYGPLLARLQACERIRHHIPNLVAVNFYRQGGLLRAVDTLNGVRN